MWIIKAKIVSLLTSSAVATQSAIVSTEIVADEAKSSIILLKEYNYVVTKWGLGSSLLWAVEEEEQVHIIYSQYQQ